VSIERTRPWSGASSPEVLQGGNLAALGPRFWPRNYVNPAWGTPTWRFPGIPDQLHGGAALHFRQPWLVAEGDEVVVPFKP